MTFNYKKIKRLQKKLAYHLKEERRILNEIKGELLIPIVKAIQEEEKDDSKTS